MLVIRKNLAKDIVTIEIYLLAFSYVMLHTLDLIENSPYLTRERGFVPRFGLGGMKQYFLDSHSTEKGIKSWNLFILPH